MQALFCETLRDLTKLGIAIALSMAIGELLDPGARSWTHVMSNCGVTDLTLEPAPELLSFNVDAHLEGL